MKILREFKEPTNIVITGQWVNSKEPSLSLTDDECSCSIRDYKGDYVSITSFGSITILTEDEFDWFLESDHYRLYCDDDFGREENMYVAIKNYVGVIGATGLYSGTEEEFDNWDIHDYFYHQVEDSDVILNISGKYNIQPMTVDEASEFLYSNKSSKVSESLSKDDKKQIAKDIDCFGLDYWLKNKLYANYDEDEELMELSVKARRFLTKVEERLKDLGVKI